MGRAKHSGEKGAGVGGVDSHDFSHYCVLPIPSLLFSLKLLEFRHKLNFFGTLLDSNVPMKLIVSFQNQIKYTTTH